MQVHLVSTGEFNHNKARTSQIYKSWSLYSVCEIPRSFERASPSNFRTHMNSRKIFERDLLSSDSVAKSAM